MFDGVAVAPDEVIGGGEIAIPLDDLGLLQALTQVLGRPRNVARRSAGLAREGVKVLAGRSAIAPEPRDWRFQDPAWKDNPVYRRVGQAYLAWADAMDKLVDDANLDWRTEERARFAMLLVTSGLAPTNFLPGNPAALKRAFETGGRSVAKGLRNFARDVIRNRGMPAQVDTSPFQVGTNIAVTPGAVVHRDDRCEVLQYTPTTAEVRTAPVMVLPPQINRYYFLDLAPGRSFVEYAVSRGLQVFMVSWRNPTAEHRDWSLDDYVGTVDGALDAVCDIAGSDDAHMMGFCAGGITAAVTEAHLAASGDSRIRTASFAVTLLDWHVRSLVGMMGAASVVAAGRRASQKKGVLDGKALGSLFSLLRPNDLVWNYWVNNNLMGESPPAFDVLAWNADSTRMPAALHTNFLDLFEQNLLTIPGAMTVAGTPIDLSAITQDAYVVGAQSDHLTPWRGCYATTQLLGGKTEFVLSSSGHIQSLVNPPGNPRMKVFTGPEPGPDPDAWLAEAQSRQGSWWEHWSDWVQARSHEEHAAPKNLGNSRHPALEAAPGTYVHSP